eukprot:Phypoly_transcript_11753.p1 GENE.Phypoly_transcript_11753~~Phypoly_transcript_11753.p1  ORF type:complete len:343 (+),score=87.24 Phypoly_transcript_11753:27-1031(+)
MDTAYLQREVGGALSKGLAAVTCAQPHDPVGYLGQWLLQYVQNQAHEKELERQAIQLEEEKKKYAEELEWERIRKEQEEKEKQEEIIAAQRAKQQIQLDMVHNFESLVAQKTELFPQEGITAQQALIRPLNLLKEKLQVIASELETHAPKIAEFYKARGITSPDHPTAKLMKASVILVGWSQLSELTDWAECKKLLRNPDLLGEIKKFSPLKRQTVNKFAVAFHLTKDFPVEEAKSTSYVSYLLWEWVTACINARKAALVVRSERLGVPLINDPVINDGSGEDEEEDLEEDLRLSEAAIKKEEEEGAREGEGEGEPDEEGEEDGEEDEGGDEED